MATNTLGIPDNVYGGGQGIFNSTPYTQYYLQQEAQKKAKDEALNKYYQDFTTRINPAGMRNIDTDGLMKRVNEMRDYYKNNADDIKNPTRDNGKAYSTYMSRYQDAMNFVNRSKNATEQKKQFLKLTPEQRSLLDQKDFDYVHKTDLPLDHNEYEDFDITKIDFNPKPFTLNDQTQYLGSVASRIKPNKLYQKTEIKNGKQVTTWVSDYDDNDIKSLLINGQSAVSDKRVNAFADNLTKNPALFLDLNEKFKAATGKNIQTNGDAFAAWTLASLNPGGESQSATNVPRVASAKNPNAAMNRVTHDITHFTVAGTDDEFKDRVVGKFATQYNPSSKVQFVDAKRGNGVVTFTLKEPMEMTVGGITQIDPKNLVNKNYTYQLNDPYLEDKIGYMLQKVSGSNAKIDQAALGSKPETTTAPAKSTEKKKPNKHGI